MQNFPTSMWPPTADARSAMMPSAAAAAGMASHSGIHQPVPVHGMPYQWPGTPVAPLFASVKRLFRHYELSRRHASVYDESLRYYCRPKRCHAAFESRELSAAQRMRGLEPQSPAKEPLRALQDSDHGAAVPTETPHHSFTATGALTTDRTYVKPGKLCLTQGGGIYDSSTGFRLRSGFKIGATRRRRRKRTGASWRRTRSLLVPLLRRPRRSRAFRNPPVTTQRRCKCQLCHGRHSLCKFTCG